MKTNKQGWGQRRKIRRSKRKSRRALRGERWEHGDAPAYERVSRRSLSREQRGDLEIEWKRGHWYPAPDRHELEEELLVA